MKTLYNVFRRMLLDILIRIIERDLYNTPVKGILDKEARANMFADLFDRTDVRQYLVERETRFVHALANTFTEQVKGQRAENLILFQKCKSAHEARQKKILSLRRDDQMAASPE